MPGQVAPLTKSGKKLDQFSMVRLPIIFPVCQCLDNDVMAVWVHSMSLILIVTCSVVNTMSCMLP